MSDREAEIEARAQLAAMAPRLGEAPHALLGVGEHAPPEALRAAFLRLTKQYHPTRYARFAPDVVRLANEVFLTIKRAYDQLRSPKPVAAGTQPLPRATSPSPAPQPPPVRAATSTPAPTPIARAVTAPTTALPRAVTAPIAAPPRPPASGRSPVLTPEPPRPRASSAPPATKPLTPVEQALEPAMELLRRKLWAEARQALLKLAVADPHEKRYRAYMHYARGRESQEAGKLDEARAEWQRATGIDPDLMVAKRALEDLPTDPPPSGGLIGRLFGKK